MHSELGDVSSWRAHKHRRCSSRPRRIYCTEVTTMPRILSETFLTLPLSKRPWYARSSGSLHRPRNIRSGSINGQSTSRSSHMEGLSYRIYESESVLTTASATEPPTSGVNRNIEDSGRTVSLDAIKTPTTSNKKTSSQCAEARGDEWGYFVDFYSPEEKRLR